MKYEEYISELQKASAECWKCFTIARENIEHASEMFLSLKMKYKHRKPHIYEYVSRYLDALRDILNIKDTLISSISDASRQIWTVLKSSIKAVYDAGEDGKNDCEFFDKVVREFINISNKDWNSEIEEYVRRYICACIDEVDRSYRRKYEIRESQV